MTSPVPEGVLILPGWSHGYCPVHVSAQHRCDRTCTDARRAVADLQADYLEFWPTYQQERVAA
jgi:hypothetical protein